MGQDNTDHTSNAKKSCPDIKLHYTTLDGNTYMYMYRMYGWAWDW